MRSGASAAKGIYQLFIGNVAATLFLALASVIVGRILGPSGYGLYSIALIVPPFLFNATRFGQDAAATRYGARLRSEGKESEAVSFAYANTVFHLATSVALALLFVVLSGFIADTVLNRPSIGAFVLPLAMLSLVGESAYTMTYQALTGLGRYGFAGGVQTLGGIARLVISTGLVFLGFGVAGAVAGFTLAYFICGFAGLAVLTGLSKGWPSSFWADVKTGLRYGFPIYLSIMATGFVLPVVYVALALAVSNTQVGGFSAAITFSTVTLLFTFPITNGLFPLFSQKVENKRGVAKVYGTTLMFTAVLVVPLASYMMAFSGPLMALLYGPEFAFSSPYLALVAAVGLFVGVGSQAFIPLLNGIGHTRDALLATALGSAVSVASAVALIPGFGVTGALLGQLLGQGVAVAVGTATVRRRLESPLGISRVWKAYAAAGLAAAICFPLGLLIPVPLIAAAAGAAAFVVLYIPFLALVKALTPEDFDTLRRYLGFSAVVSGPLDMAIRYYRAVSGRQSA